MSEVAGLFLGQADEAQHLLFKRANRHGVVAGATGTGKTVTLQILAQGFSDAGVPVFCADVKGDLSGISQPGSPNERLIARAEGMGLDLAPAAAPTVFWDIFGERGHPVRATISEVGPLLMARMLELNDTQTDVLSVVFHVADKEGLLLLDLADLRSLLAHVAENAAEIGRQYGHVAPATLAAIQRSLLALEKQGASGFFGEPALRLEDLIRTDLSGKGQVNVLAAERLMSSPRLYAAFLLWLLSELFEQLPEVGDPEKPRLVFFFDEAHLLFNDTPRALLEKVEQVVRLIRSKGVGVYFITQNPADIPSSVLSQLGNRIQHALRAYTPADQRGLRAASESFRPNPAFDTAETIQALETGEALVSVLDEKGAPTIVARTKIRPPSSRMGPATDAERAAVMAASPVRGVYDQMVDRESAHEVLEGRRQALEQQAAAEAASEQAPAPRTTRAPRSTGGQTKSTPRPRASNRQTHVEAATKTMIRTVSNTLARELVRGVLGGLRRR